MDFHKDLVSLGLWDGEFAHSHIMDAVELEWCLLALFLEAEMERFSPWEGNIDGPS